MKSTNTKSGGTGQQGWVSTASVGLLQIQRVPWRGGESQTANIQCVFKVHLNAFALNEAAFASGDCPTDPYKGLPWTLLHSLTP